VDEAHLVTALRQEGFDLLLLPEGLDPPDVFDREAVVAGELLGVRAESSRNGSAQRG